MALSGGNPSRGCVYTLDQSGSSNGIIANGVNVNAALCTISSNSKLNVNGSTLDSKAITYAGTGRNDFTSNGATYGAGGGSPTLSGVAADPCPQYAGFNYLQSNPTPTGPAIGRTIINGKRGKPPAQMYPGVYSSMVIINGSDVVMNPGTYVFQGGINANGSTISGTGVTLYDEGGQMNVNGATLNLTAPATGNNA